MADLRHQLLQTVLHSRNAVAKLTYLPVKAHDVRRGAGEIPCRQPVNMRYQPTQRRNHPSGHAEPDDSRDGKQQHRRKQEQRLQAGELRH